MADRKYDASSAAEAVSIARRLAVEGKADIFRGQNRPWPLVPSSLRLAASASGKAGNALDRFQDWAENVPQMSGYAGNRDGQTAIAQHYGIPTRFLDWSTEPTVALYFAQEPSGDPPSESAVIYCLTRADIDAGAGRLLDIPVANLWRLKAQHGLFLEVASIEQAEALRERCITITFPPGTNDPADREQIYPQRKSALEVAIDEWLYRDELDLLLNEVTANTKHVATIKRRPYSGIFRWRAVPPRPRDWILAHFTTALKGEQPLPKASSRITVAVDVAAGLALDAQVERVKEQLRDGVHAGHGESALLDVTLQLPQPAQQHSDSIRTLIERCWDGMRPYPYSADQVLACLSLTLAVLAGRAIGAPWRDRWPEILYKRTEVVEFAPFGGHICSAVISRSDLHKAIRADAGDLMTSYFRRLLKRDRHKIFRYVTEPWHIFSQEKYRDLYARQVLPSALDGYWTSDLELHDGKLGGFWDIGFDPVHPGYFTPAEYRFRSPLQMEEKPDDLIVVTKDMSPADLRDAFTFAYPKAAFGNAPFTVRFADYGLDPRELCDIPEVERKCRVIVDCGGISVLKVFPDLTGASSGPDEGLTAFHIWLLSQGMLRGAGGTKVEFERAVIDRFYEELMLSNGAADSAFQNYVAEYGPPPPPLGSAAP